MDNKSSSSEEINNKKNKSESYSSNASENSPKSNNDEEEQLVNYFSYISDCSTKIEENRQNYFNKLSELKSQIEHIKEKSIASIDFAMLIISEFITLCDTFYSSFSEQKKILEKFSELNESAQNFNFCYEKVNYSLLYFKQSNKKINKQYKKLYKENQKLHQIIKEMNTIIKNKINKENDLKDNNAEKEIKNKMKKVMEENIELKQRYSQVLTDSKRIKDYADKKYQTEQENNQRMSALLNKIDLYEEKIGHMQKQIKQYETERVNAEKKEKEKEKENESKTINVNNIYENENTINLDTNKSELSDNISIKQGINLEELLENQNDVEEEEKLSVNININNEQKNFDINQKSEKNSDYSSRSIKRYNEYDVDNDIEISPNFLMLCPIKKQEKKKKGHQKSNKIYESPFSNIPKTKSYSSLVKNKKKNAQSVINGGNRHKNYYKIYFFLLLKSIIINKNIREFFKKNDFDSLYEECEKGRIPFNQYEEWIINKFRLDGDKNEKYLYNSVINDCFISSSII